MSAIRMRGLISKPKAMVWSGKMSWWWIYFKHVSLAKKAQQRLYFLRKLRRARAPPPIMCTFYRGTIESILTSCFTVWYGACNASCRKSLQRIVRAAEKIVGVSPPLPPGHLQHPSHPQSPQHCRWSHPPDTQLLQSATIREETEESPSQDKQTERQLHPPGCQEAELPPVLAPPPLSYPMNHWTLTPTPAPPLTRTHTHTHTLTLTLTLRQAPVTCTALDWPHSTTSSDSLNKKDCSLSL